MTSLDTLDARILIKSARGDGRGASGDDDDEEEEDNDDDDDEEG